MLYPLCDLKPGSWSVCTKSSIVQGEVTFESSSPDFGALPPCRYITRRPRHSSILYTEISAVPSPRQHQTACAWVAMYAGITARLAWWMHAAAGTMLDMTLTVSSLNALQQLSYTINTALA